MDAKGMETVSGRLPALLAGMIVVVAGVALLDAVFTTEYDFAVVFGLLAGFGAVQAIALVVHPPTIELRRDVARWLTERSRLSGEPVGRIADRAVTSYRSALGEDERALEPGPDR